MTIAFTAAICIETVSQRFSQVTQFVKKVFRVFLTFLGFLIIVKFSLILKKIHRDNMDILPVSSLSLFSLISHSSNLSSHSHLILITTSLLYEEIAGISFIHTQLLSSCVLGFQCLAWVCLTLQRFLLLKCLYRLSCDISSLVVNWGSGDEFFLYIFWSMWSGRLKGL